MTDDLIGCRGGAGYWEKDTSGDGYRGKAGDQWDAGAQTHGDNNYL